MSTCFLIGMGQTPGNSPGMGNDNSSGSAKPFKPPMELNFKPQSETERRIIEILYNNVQLQKEEQAKQQQQQQQQGNSGKSSGKALVSNANAISRQSSTAQATTPPSSSSSSSSSSSLSSCSSSTTGSSDMALLSSHSTSTQFQQQQFLQQNASQPPSTLAAAAAAVATPALSMPSLAPPLPKSPPPLPPPLPPLPPPPPPPLPPPEYSPPAATSSQVLQHSKSLNGQEVDTKVGLTSFVSSTQQTTSSTLSVGNAGGIGLLSPTGCETSTKDSINKGQLCQHIGKYKSRKTIAF